MQNVDAFIRFVCCCCVPSMDNSMLKVFCYVLLYSLFDTHISVAFHAPIVLFLYARMLHCFFTKSLFFLSFSSMLRLAYLLLQIASPSLCRCFSLSLKYTFIKCTKMPYSCTVFFSELTHALIDNLPVIILSCFVPTYNDNQCHCECVLDSHLIL